MQHPKIVTEYDGSTAKSGLDACRRIREKARAKDVVIVAATGWGQEEYRRRSEEAGCDHHLVKPVDAAELGRLLARGKR